MRCGENISIFSNRAHNTQVRIWVLAHTHSHSGKSFRSYADVPLWASEKYRVKSANILSYASVITGYLHWFPHYPYQLYTRLECSACVWTMQCAKHFNNFSTAAMQRTQRTTRVTRVSNPTVRTQLIRNVSVAGQREQGYFVDRVFDHHITT